ncbi:hypothetical protein KJ969_02905 [Patescibacteria group bacterium]|nr:hypothetical protein [Patescibacteria group bacterium]MBU1922169.1 hypothetical protein [Patescibacteria group bacterium]
MEKVEVVFKIVRQLFWSLLLQGLFLVILGILVAIFPELLVALVSVIFIVLGVTIIIIAIKVYKYSKLTVRV